MGGGKEWIARAALDERRANDSRVAGMGMGIEEN